MSLVESRFWAKVDFTDDCWIWTGARSGLYGSFRIDGASALAHRVAYELVMGPIPPGCELDHRRTCSKLCVHPMHLRPTSHKQNMENHSGPQKNNTSGVRGVSWLKARAKWRVLAKHQGRTYFGGYFTDIEKAEAAAIALRNRLHTNNDADRLDAP